MTRPEFYGVRVGLGVTHLCRCCAAVLVCEGHLGGDPMGDVLEAEAVTEMWPIGDEIASQVAAKCANCEALRRFEERRASLGAPPQRIGTGVAS